MTEKSQSSIWEKEKDEAFSGNTGEEEPDEEKVEEEDSDA